MSNPLLRINVRVKTLGFFVLTFFMFLAVAQASQAAPSCGTANCVCAAGVMQNCDIDQQSGRYTWRCVEGQTIKYCGLCGDGARQAEEPCEGADLNNRQCTDYGYVGGTLACKSTCQFDFNNCVAAGCGDGQVVPPEQCDGANLNGMDCRSLGYDMGLLLCSSTCQFNTSNCMRFDTPDDVCGDGLLTGSEECELPTFPCTGDNETCVECQCVTSGTENLGCADRDGDGLPDNPTTSDWSTLASGNKPCAGCGEANKKVVSQEPYYNLCVGNGSGPALTFVVPSYYTPYNNYYSDLPTSHNDTLAKWTWNCTNDEYTTTCEAYPRSVCNTDIAAQVKCDATTAPDFATEKAFKEERDKKTGDRYCLYGKYYIYSGDAQDCRIYNPDWNVNSNESWQCIGLSDGETEPLNSTVNNEQCSAKWRGAPVCGALDGQHFAPYEEHYPDNFDCGASEFFDITGYYDTIGAGTSGTGDFCEFGSSEMVVGSLKLTQTANPKHSQWTWQCMGANGQIKACQTDIDDTCLPGQCGEDSGKIFPIPDVKRYPGQWGDQTMCSLGRVLSKYDTVLGSYERGEVVDHPENQSGTWRYVWRCLSPDGKADGNPDCSAVVAGKCGPASEKILRSTTEDTSSSILGSLPLSEKCAIGNMVRLTAGGNDCVDRDSDVNIGFYGGADAYNYCQGVQYWYCGTATNNIYCWAEETYPVCGYSSSAPSNIGFEEQQAVWTYNNNGVYDMSNICLRGNGPDPDSNDSLGYSDGHFTWTCYINGQDYLGEGDKYYNTEGASRNCQAQSCVHSGVTDCRRE